MFADVTSANVVGYVTKDTPNGKFQIGTVPFETTKGTLKLQDLLTGFTPVDIDWEAANPWDFVNTAAQLQIWNVAKNNYDFAYFVNNAWLDDGSDDGLFVDNCWCDGDGSPLLDYEFIPGGAYWVKNVVDDKPLSIAGAVNDASYVSYPCTDKFALAGNAFPVAIALDSKAQMKSDDITPVDIDWEAANPWDFVNTATQLQIWNKAKNNYDFAYFVNNAWLDDGSDDGLFVDNCWCDGDGSPLVGYTIPAGNGFWVKAVSGDCTLDFLNPIK